MTTTFLLIPGADGRAWLWHRVVPEIERRGHGAIAVDMPRAATAGWDDYADAAVTAGRDHRPLVVVGQSMGAFTAPLVCGHLDVDLLVPHNPMIPAPGETPNDWWANTGHAKARAAAAEREGRSTAFDVRTEFGHDLDPEIVEQMMSGEVADLTTVFGQPWPLAHWPGVPTRIVQGREDRFFPLDFQRRLAAERLGITDIDEIPGGHAAPLSRPAELADRLIGYLDEAGAGPVR